MFMALSPHRGADSSGAGRRVSAPQLNLHGPDDPQRGAVEDFIRGVYAEHYRARVRHFAPLLVSLRDDGEIVAAAGYRSASEGELFLERYLPAPIESLLGSRPDARPARERIVEVGHLAASRAGEGRRLILLLGPHLAAHGFEWVVGTLTHELRQLFVRLGITPLALGTADPAALGDDAAHWGSYYDHRPMVLAGQLRHALRLLARRSSGGRP